MQSLLPRNTPSPSVPSSPAPPSCRAGVLTARLMARISGVQEAELKAAEVKICVTTDWHLCVYCFPRHGEETWARAEQSVAW